MANKINQKWMKIRWGAAGFSLVEIMVGMVVGLITIVVIMQSFSAFEAQKRTTTSGSDTLENGLIALQAIEADARSAGYGLLTPNGLACTSMIYYEAGITAVPASAPIAPVAVVDGGPEGGSDKVTFTVATAPSAGMPRKLNADMPTALSDPNVDTFQEIIPDQDMFLVAKPILSPGTGAVETPCSRLPFASAVVSIYETLDPVLELQMFPTGGYPMINGSVISIGSYLNGAAGFKRTQYRVNENNDLVVEDVSHMFAQSTVVLASNIVNMQVQYGVAPANSQPGISSPSVSCWTNAVDRRADATATADCKADWRTSSAGATPRIVAGDIMRIKAIRIAVVARSPLQEKPSVAGGTCDATPASSVMSTASGVVAWPGGPAIDLTANPTWRCHRYRVYQTIIPLRNVIWANI